MTSKKELEKKLEYARGYRDAIVDTWEAVIKLATKGYSSREMQIMSKTMASDSRARMEEKIAELEADCAQEDIIDTDYRSGIPQPPPAPKKTPELMPGMSVMFKESRPAKCYQAFEREIAAGRPGLCVARLSPREIRDNYDIGKAHVIWLTHSEKDFGNLPPSALGLSGGAADQAGADDDYVNPGGSGLPMIFSQILNFLEGRENGVVLIEGVEYMTSHAKFESVMSFIQKVNENVKSYGANLIVSVNQSAFEPRQFSHLETEMSQVI